MFPILNHTCTQPVFSKWLISTQAHQSRNHCFSEVQAPDQEIPWTEYKELLNQWGIDLLFKSGPATVIQFNAW